MWRSSWGSRILPLFYLRSIVPHSLILNQPAELTLPLESTLTKWTFSSVKPNFPVRKDGQSLGSAEKWVPLWFYQWVVITHPEVKPGKSFLRNQGQQQSCRPVFWNWRQEHLGDKQPQLRCLKRWLWRGAPESQPSMPVPLCHSAFCFQLRAPRISQWEILEKTSRGLPWWSNG